jgi:hypothetical protein
MKRQEPGVEAEGHPATQRMQLAMATPCESLSPVNSTISCTHGSIGRIRASCCWRAAKAAGSDADRLEALRELIRQAQEYDADAYIDLDCEIDCVTCSEISDVPLLRVTATGIAVTFSGDA